MRLSRTAKIGGLTALALLIPYGYARASSSRRRKSASRGLGGYPYPLPRIVPGNVPHAEGAASPAWPVDPNSANERKFEVAYKDVKGRIHGNVARSFHSLRDNGARWHAGIDLYADAGDIVRAPEAGTIRKTQTFKGGTHAMLLDTDTGLTILLGEVKKKSWDEFGVEPGSRVSAADPVARVGVIEDTGSHMLHMEIYKCCPATNVRWYYDKPAPKLLLDPTDYLLRAKARIEAVA